MLRKWDEQTAMHFYDISNVCNENNLEAQHLNEKEIPMSKLGCTAIALRKIKTNSLLIHQILTPVMSL